MSTAKIVVVSNNERIRCLVRDILQGASYTATGCDYDSSYIRTVFSCLQPDISIIDIGLKWNKLGRDALEYIKEKYPNVRIILISEIILENEARDLGAKFFIKKPFDAPTLLGRVYQCLLSWGE